MSRKFIAWDGEGIKNPDRYVLLANSEGYKVRNVNGLTTIECLDLIWVTARRFPKAIHVIFAGKYDFNNWLRELDYDASWWIWKGLPVKIGRYTVNYNRASFTVSRGRKRVQIWDVWRFWQSSFVNALKQNLPDHPNLAAIAHMKGERAVFQWSDMPEIERYCDMELAALVELMERLHADLIEAGIGTLTAWNGAGSVAAKLLQTYNVGRHIAPLPPMVLEAAYGAYSGGRIELWQYGHHHNTFHTYDVRSAYPYALTKVPSLVDGEWDTSPRRSLEIGSEFAIYKVRFATRKSLRGYPFFQRLPSGAIIYPPNVTGWYWYSEVVAARRLGIDFDILAGCVFRPKTSDRPFAFVPDLFAHRASLKAAGKHGAQLLVKLGLNSLYGKTAQTVGGTAANPPPFHSIAYAGFITAQTHAMVYEAAMQKPDSVAYIATDGIGCTEELTLDEGLQIGQWEHSAYSSALVAQAGVYFLWENDGTRHDKYRGFPRGSLEPDAITEAWRRRRESLFIDSERFVTLGTALASGDWFDRRCTWINAPRELRLDYATGKRERSLALRRYHRPWERLEPLDPFFVPSHTVSEPYKPRWKSIPSETLEDDLEEVS